MTKECCLRSVTTIPQMIKWIELMLGLDLDSNDYKIDRPYIQEQFDKENYKLPYHSKILQKYSSGFLRINNKIKYLKIFLTFE